ncbi:MAG: type II toxin-antitoxin system RelE/ParE family toxin [Armatimonadetes bacterium]|nr:type II toxin-antitoxin system RelE/ParE family toxin [Armatimonadota bacterium]
MALMRVDLHPEAVAEASAAYEWYRERSAAAAEGFASELEHALARILEAPAGWSPHLHGTRRHVMRHYPYQVVYRVREDAIEVVAVAHCRRKPGYWRHR